MALPWRPRLLVAGVLAGAAAIVAGILRHYPWVGLGPVAPLAVLGGLATVAWIRPLLVYRGNSSECVQCDEGLLLIGLLVLPPAGVLVVFAAALTVAQALRPRPVVKFAFNLGQVTLAAGLAVVVDRAVAGPPHPMLSAASLGTAGLGVLAFSAVSSGLSAWILAVAAAIPLRRALLDGIDLRLAVLVADCVAAAPVAFAAADTRWGIALLPPLFFVLRGTLSARFDARHDRDRLLGLFEATLSIHRPIETDAIREELISVARRLLRCSQVLVSPRPAADAQLASAITVQDEVWWLALSGRSSREPFDAADQRLLDALAAVGGSALSHAAMFGQLGHQREELAAIMGSLTEGVFAFDANGQPIFVNRAGEQLLGVVAAELAGGGTTLAAADALAPLTAIARRCLLGSHPHAVDEASSFVDRHGRPFPVSYTCSAITDDAGVVGAVLAFRDISDRVAAERELAHHAFHDQLTGLPNRRLFLERLDQALRRGERSAGVHAVLFADVDRFKLINDSLGHGAGDELLVEIARRICRLARPSDTVARFGGDEFTILLEDAGDGTIAEAMADRIHAALRAPIQLASGREVVATVSIGTATTEGQRLPDDVLHNADVAMYQAKSDGASGTHRYDAAAMRTRSAQRLDLEADLRRALSHDQLEVSYQPLVDVASGSVVDLEALVRWQHPQGLRMPSDFIPIAEETGLILPLGRMVLGAATRQARRWADRGTPVGVAVNLSARQFQYANLVGDIQLALDSSGLAAEHLCVEITESLAMRDLDETIRTLGQLKELGVRLAIDDFGTGYSSLSYLKRFPVDVVKIDQSFVRDIDTSAVDRAIVSAIVGLTETMGIVTVAEGVEDERQLIRLRELGCRLAQGYHLSRPRSPEDISLFLAKVPRPRQPEVAGRRLRALPG